MTGAGAPGKAFIKYAPCCKKGEMCLIDSGLGWGRWCVAPKKGFQATYAKKCYKSGERCMGSPGKPYIPYHRCCDGSPCVKSSKLGWGGFCVGAGGEKKSSAGEMSKGRDGQKCYNKGHRCMGAPGKTYVPYARCCDGTPCVKDPRKGWGGWCKGEIKDSYVSPPEYPKHDEKKDEKTHEKQAEDYSQPDYPEQKFSKDDYSQPDYPKPDYSKVESPKHEYSQKDYPKPDYSKDKSPKHDYTQPDYPKTDYLKSESPKNDYTQTHHPKPNYPTNTYPKPDYPDHHPKSKPSPSKSKDCQYGYYYDSYHGCKKIHDKPKKDILPPKDFTCPRGGEATASTGTVSVPSTQGIVGTFKIVIPPSLTCGTDSSKFPLRAARSLAGQLCGRVRLLAQPAFCEFTAISDGGQAADGPGRPVVVQVSVIFLCQIWEDLSVTSRTALAGLVGDFSENSDRCPAESPASS